MDLIDTNAKVLRFNWPNWKVYNKMDNNAISLGYFFVLSLSLHRFYGQFQIFFYVTYYSVDRSNCFSFALSALSNNNGPIKNFLPKLTHPLWVRLYANGDGGLHYDPLIIGVSLTMLVLVYSLFSLYILSRYELFPFISERIKINPVLILTRSSG